MIAPIDTHCTIAGLHKDAWRFKMLNIEKCNMPQELQARLLLVQREEVISLGVVFEILSNEDSHVS